MKYIVNTIKYVMSFTALMIFATEAQGADALTSEYQSRSIEDNPCYSGQYGAGDRLFGLLKKLRETPGYQTIHEVRERQYRAAQAQYLSFPERVCSRSPQSDTTKSYQRPTASTRAKVKTVKK